MNLWIVGSKSQVGSNPTLSESYGPSRDNSMEVSGIIVTKALSRRIAGSSQAGPPIK